MLLQTEKVWKEWHELPSHATPTGSKSWLHMESSATRTDADITARRRRENQFLLLKEFYEKSGYLRKKDAPFWSF